MFLSSALALLLGACGFAKADKNAVDNAALSEKEGQSEPVGVYDFSKPTFRQALPMALREISGLTVLDAEHVGAVQDEDGKLYILNAADGSLDMVVPFGPPGDYEGIELAGERLFVLRSDGVLFELVGWLSGKITPRAFDLDLGAKNCNAESLGSDGNRLLIVCKEDNKQDRNEVWSFDLSTGKRSPQPVFELDSKLISGKGKLRPSAAGMRPASRQWVIVFSKRDALVVIDSTGKTLDVWDLGPADLPQPEGITFMPNGDLLLASEGGDGPGVLTRFRAAVAE